MIARFLIALPFDITMQEGSFVACDFESEGLRGRIYPPFRANDVPARVKFEEVKVEGAPGFTANALRIDFRGESFDRRPPPDAIRVPQPLGEAVIPEGDPPYTAMREVAEMVVSRLRYVTGAAHARDDLEHQPWAVHYLNDDESELPEEPGLMRKRGVDTRVFHPCVVTPAVWGDVFSDGANAPAWEKLLLDARALTREVGPAVVLAFTALEVFVNHALSAIAAGDPAREPLWKWISKLEYPRRPGIADLYDGVLEAFLGASLKSEPRLWERFKNLQKARNRFAHRGVASVGDDDDLSRAEAIALVAAAREIIDWVHERLPEAARWERFRHEERAEATFRLPRRVVAPLSATYVTAIRESDA